MIYYKPPRRARRQSRNWSGKPYFTAETQSSQRSEILDQELFTLRPQRLRGWFSFREGDL
jgi:hypothetical protein